MGNLPPEEFTAMQNYMHQIFMRDGSTEYAIFIQFHVGMFAKNYLEHEDRLLNPELNLPMSFFYGDIDWMDEESGKRIVNQNRYREAESKIYIVSNSDHHMYLDNPEEFARLIIEDIGNSERYNRKRSVIKEEEAIKKQERRFILN